MLYLVSVLICDMAAMTLFDFDFVDLVAVVVELLVELLVVAILLRVLHPRVLLLLVPVRRVAGGIARS
jgi:hypothetical protein